MCVGVFVLGEEGGVEVLGFEGVCGGEIGQG